MHSALLIQCTCSQLRQPPPPPPFPAPPAEKRCSKQSFDTRRAVLRNFLQRRKAYTARNGAIRSAVFVLARYSLYPPVFIWWAPAPPTRVDAKSERSLFAVCQRALFSRTVVSVLQPPHRLPPPLALSERRRRWKRLILRQRKQLCQGCRLQAPSDT